MADSNSQPQMPAPDPALKRLDRFVGTWSLEGHLVGSSENTITGQASYRWLASGFFLEQRIELDFMGMKIDSLELIGYDPETETFPSTVYSNMSPSPLPYRWAVGDDTVTISVSYGLWTQRSMALSARTAGASAVAGVRTQARTRP
jgi:hypothetical protein